MSACIIGGGYSGVIGAKVCKSNNLSVTIINKQPTAGGIWTGHPGEVGVWNSLTMNASKFGMPYSDYLWRGSGLDYGPAQEVVDYIEEYIDYHDLRSSFINNSTVYSVERQNEGYLVKWKNSNNESSERVFDYVVVATGRYVKPDDIFKGQSKFQGEILNGAYYREPSVFTGKKVVCVGKSFTASDVAVEALGTAESVTQVYRKPYFCVPRYVKNIPYDLLFYSFSYYNDEMDYISNFKQSGMFCRLMLDLIGNPGTFYEDWQIDENTIYNEFYAYSSHKDEYFQAVKQGRIKQVKGTPKELYEHGILLSDGRQIEADTILLGTGYFNDYDFLSDEIKEIIQYDPNDKITATILFRSIFHPDLKNFCFIGAFTTDIPGRFELQAEIGVRFMLGKLNLDMDYIRKGVEEELYARKNLRAFPWPYDYYGYLKDCIKILDIKIDFEFLNELGFGNGPIMSYFFFFDRPGQREIAAKAIQEIKELYPFYDFS